MATRRGRFRWYGADSLPKEYIFQYSYIKWSADGSRLLVLAPMGYSGSMALGTAKGNDYVLDVYDVAYTRLESSTEVAKSLQMVPFLAAISPQDLFICYVGADRRLYVWEISTGRRSDITSAIAGAGDIGRILSLDYVNDELLLISVGNKVIAYHANSSKAYSLFSFDQDIFSPPLFPEQWKFLESPPPIVTEKKLLLRYLPKHNKILVCCYHQFDRPARTLFKLDPAAPELSEQETKLMTEGRLVFNPSFSPFSIFPGFFYIELPTFLWSSNHLWLASYIDGVTALALVTLEGQVEKIYSPVTIGGFERIVSLSTKEGHAVMLSASGDGRGKRIEHHFFDFETGLIQRLSDR